MPPLFRKIPKRPVTPQYVEIHDRINAAYEDAMSAFRDEDGNILDARNNAMVSMHQTNTIKRVLEAAKVDHAVEEANRILDAGGNVVVFVETKAYRFIGRYRASQFFDKSDRLYTYPEIREEMAFWQEAVGHAQIMGDARPPRPFAEFIVQIARAMHEAGIEYELPSVEDQIVEKLGGTSKVAIYTGSVSNSAASKDKEAFLAGKKRVIVATMAKGGTGLSLHDKVGNRETWQVNLNLPWRATGVDQVSGRVARYGLQSKAHINWLFADNIPFERMLAGRVGRRMRDMGALVKGIDMKAARVLTDEFDFQGTADVKQREGEVSAPDMQDDIWALAERLEKSRSKASDTSMGFFETPYPIAALMTEVSGARGNLLEPSGGRGNLVRFVKDNPKVTTIKIIEARRDNADYLKGQYGDRVTQGDFLEEADSLGKFDTIHMNPPFERVAGVGAQDVAHVMKAFDLLEDNGRLVAIMGEGAFFRNYQQEREFRQWLDDRGAIVVKLPENAFKNSGTGVRTRMVILDKNGEAGRTDIDLEDMDTDSLQSVADAIPTRDSVQMFSSSPLYSSAPEQSDLFAAATAPDAADKFGDVKVGRMNALAAYRTLTAKRNSGKALDAKEEQQLLDAEQALGQKLAFDMEGVKSDAPATDKESLTAPPPVFGQNRRATQDEMMRTGEVDRSGQISLLSSAVHWPRNLYAYDYRTAFLGGDVQHIVRAYNERTGLKEDRKFDTFEEAKAEMDRLDDLASPVLFTSSPENDPFQLALSKMPPIYGEVFRAVEAGMSPEDVAAKFNVPSKAVTNILNEVRSRAVIAAKAQAGTLKPETNADGKFVNGRPDLAEGANPDFVAIDQNRNESGIPDVVSMEENYAEADRRLAANYEGEFARLERMAASGQRPDRIDIALAKQIFRRETLSGGLADPQRRARVALFRVAYREQGTEQGRAFQMRRDEALTPAERNALHFTELLYEPSPQVQERMEGADPETRDAILKKWMDQIDAFKAEMKADGIDIEASLAAWHAHKAAVEKAEQVHSGTKTAMDEAFMKLSPPEKMVIRLIRDKAKLSTVMRQTGMTQEQVMDVKRRFGMAWKQAIIEAGKKFAANSLASSAPEDIYDMVMSDLGWQSDEDFNDLAPDYFEKQDQKRKDAKARERKRKELAPMPVFTPEQQAAIDAAFEEFKKANPSTWKAWWQELSTRLTPMIGQTSFEQFKERVMQPWKDRWQTEMDGIAKASSRISFEDWISKPANTDKAKREKDMFPHPINETTGTWNETRGYRGQGELFREEINETTGTFDVNDPVVMAEVVNEWARRNGSWINKLTEFYKMAILSGPQTMLVNASGGLYVGYDLTVKRATEAAWNGLMGMFGAGDVRSATFSEFLPMLKQVHAAASLAARNALESWKLQSPVFDSYASAKPIQLDFTGVGPEYAPPATTSAISRFLRNITFRELTAVDEFWKGMFAQMDVAALAHRIAAKEEGLSGKAYTERVEQLMKRGSIAWQRSITRTKRATFQDEIAYGKWTAEDEKKNPAHKEGMPMTWRQALKKSETESAWTILDAIAAKAMEARKTPFFGPLLHVFALPFIATPKNMIQRGLEVTPLGLVVDLIDGMRSLRRRVMSGQITKEESNRIASELYNNTRFIQLLTNQTMGVMIYLAVESLTGGDDDDKYGRPVITGTLPFSATKKGERDTAQAVMPPQSIRIGETIIPYGRIEPFATALSAMVDLAASARRNEGYNAQVVTDSVVGMKEQFKDKLFLKGLGDILRVIENPERGADRLAAGWITGFIPNILRQPIRETDKTLRDTNPQADDGFITAVGKRIGYSVAPQFAPAKLDVWGNEIPSNRGELIGGSTLADSVFRIFDPFNVRTGGKIRPIDAWIFHYNASQPDSSQRIGIEPLGDEVTIAVPGETKPRKIALTAQEHAEAIRRIGQAAQSLLGDEWDWKTATAPDAAQRADLIKDTFTTLKRQETERLKIEKVAAATK